MQALNEYVAQKNKWNAIFGGAPLDLNSAKDRAEIAASIDADLSPENLSCDGELSRTATVAKYRKLSTVAKQLQKLDSTVTIYEL